MLRFKHTADISETELVETFGEDVFNILLRGLDENEVEIIEKMIKGME